MKNVIIFLQGKKTYISAAALALVAILGWWLGAINETNALALLSAAGVAAGLGAKSERYGQLLLTALSDVRDAQAQHTSVVAALKSQAVQHQADLAAIALKVAPELGIVAGRVITPVPTPTQEAIREAEETQHKIDQRLNEVAGTSPGEPLLSPPTGGFKAK